MDKAKQEQTDITSGWIERINPLVLPLGYEVVHLEIQTHRQKTLRLFIDFAEARGGRAIGIEDCVAVTRALDEPLDGMTELEAVFKGTYELEVSSPGADRPLRLARDYERFAGQEVRIHTFRPLTAAELGNDSYFEKNPRQKNFMGTLLGIRSSQVLLAVSAGSSADKARSAWKRETSKEREKAGAPAEISIPLPLISKAHLEPRFDFGPKDSGEDLR